MFSPEIFYEFIKQQYSTDNDILLVPKLFGDKNLNHWIPLLDKKVFDKWWSENSLVEKYSKNLIYMYDQEPLFPSAVDSLRQVPNIWAHEKFSEIIFQTSFANILGTVGSGGIRTINIPIWCHSELYSKEIEELQNNLFVPCYYWYHAFIARDWFRHYHRDRHLQIQNKSDSPYRFLLYARDFSGSRKYRQHLIENLRSYRDQIYYPWNDDYRLGPEESARIEVSDANVAGIHLVAETLFNENKLYLTEKIFKPMVMSQPFIVWGPPGTLNYLRSYGFQTFDDVWSEDYDAETDHDARMHMLLDLVKKIAGLSQDQYRDMYSRCLPILEHNRRWFFGDKFMDHCWDELDRNFNQALAIREDLRKSHPGGQLCYILGGNPELCSVDIFQNLLDKILIGLPDQSKEILQNRYPHFNL